MNRQDSHMSSSELDAKILDIHKKLFQRQKSLLFRRDINRKKFSSFKRKFDHVDSEIDSWKIELPDWVLDQRNQMTGPADDRLLIVKMLNSGAPGVMIDLEDSCVNKRFHIDEGIRNSIMALEGTLYHGDQEIKSRDAVIFIRPRGLHLYDTVIVGGKEEKVSASVYDVCSVMLGLDLTKLNRPPCFYIPKSEHSEEALWWRDLFREVSDVIGVKSDYIKCMALVESFPLVYQLDRFIYNLRENILGLNLGRWDLMASYIHFNINDPEWLFPDRNSVPHNVPFFQAVRCRLVNACHRRGILAIGGMTALYPNRKDNALNARALQALKHDKRNEADLGFDGAWTGHPDQNEISLKQFPSPNQLGFMHPPKKNDVCIPPVNLRLTRKGLEEALRTSIIYRLGVFHGRGASLIDGYMEDLATDRINRLIVAQRLMMKLISLESLLETVDKISLRLIHEMISQEDVAEIIKIKHAANITLESILTNRFEIDG